MKLIDTHAHLDEIKDIEGTLARAKEAGIRAVVGVGTDLAANEKILELADQYPVAIADQTFLNAQDFFKLGLP